jgi:tellurite resistance protein TerC
MDIEHPAEPTTPAPHRSRLRRAAIAVAGATVVLTGIAMIPLPGPAIVVIPAGISILALEFDWAKRLRDKGRQRLARFGRKR